MKKNFLGTIFCLLIMIGSTVGCSEDKGNYDYVNINEAYVDTVGQKTSFVVGQYEVLDITPNIKFTQSDRKETDFTYKWVIYPNSYVQANNTLIAVLSEEKNLNTVITQAPLSTDYAVVLYITDKETGLVSQTTYIVSVQASILSGIMVLHGNNQEYDLDYIATPNTVPVLDANRWLKNVYSEVEGAKIKGAHPFVSTVRKNNTVVDYVYAGTDGMFVQLGGKDFKKQYEGNDLFKTAPSKIFPQAFVSENRIDCYFNVLINNNKIHNINNRISPAWDFTFSYMLEPENTVNGGLNIAPYIYMNDIGNYSSYTGAIVYDNNSRKFLYIPVTTEEESKLKNFVAQTTSLDINNIGKELLYMGKGYNGEAFAIFTDGASRELYKINFNISGANLSDKIQAKRYVLDNQPEALSAKFYACGRNGNVFLYASNKNIYVYEYIGSEVAVKINNDFPAGEEITRIHLYNPEGMPALNDVTGTILYVATWNGTEGKIYEFAINRTSGRLENNKEPLNVFTGFDRIEDIATKVQGIGSL
ncbi:PKD-like family lipoprotein [Dysgonomonas sp. BGC7]|uniref:PKD-like family lipoprotein n=1 Tax=Dysgonomonas sp. BGC7 TaxID=1658008 RepID=UPI0009E5A5D4|nr:PKD-like family lipoprotein [Dysgonomonas sp. BGC7]MBD8387126.1 hypothetical protein [Dysgonomonas sp. BGC7]